MKGIAITNVTMVERNVHAFPVSFVTLAEGRGTGLKDVGGQAAVILA